jgi:hypothetical protein
VVIRFLGIDMDHVPLSVWQAVQLEPMIGAQVMVALETLAIDRIVVQHLATGRLGVAFSNASNLICRPPLTTRCC